MAEMIRTEDKLACAKRELTMRERVYPRWTASGKMTQAKADLEIATMRAIVADYEAIEVGERLI